MSGSEVLLDMEDILKDVYPLVYASDIADRLETHLSRLMRYIRQHPEQKEDLIDLKERLKTLIQRYHQESLQERIQRGPQTMMTKRGRPRKEVIDSAPIEESKRRRRGSTGIENGNALAAPQNVHDPSEDQSLTFQGEKIRKGDPIEPDRRYDVREAALLIGKKPNTLYDYNSRKGPDGTPNPKIPFGKDNSGGVWYFGRDLIQFLNRKEQGIITRDGGNSEGRRKHEGKGRRKLDRERPLAKLRLSELKTIKKEKVLTGRRSSR